MKNEFLKNDRIINLNSGTQSLSARKVLEEIHQIQFDYEKNPTIGMIDAYPRLWQVQKNVATFLKASPYDLFLRSNVTEVLNEMILGIELPPGSEILTTDIEYQAVINIIRYRCQINGNTFRQVHIDPLKVKLGGDQLRQNLLDTLLNEIQDKTKMLVISHVATGNGLIFPVKELSKELSKLGIILVVDGAHALGSIPVDFEDLNEVDCYGSNFHKWMMGPKGTALGRIHPRIQEKIRPLRAGWTTFDTSPPHDTFAEGKLFPCKMMPLGSLNYAPYLALQTMLDFWQHHGQENIRKEIYRLQLLLKEMISTELKEFCLVSPPENWRGPLLTYHLPKHLESKGYELLKELYVKESLQIAMTKLQNRWCMRFSPHIYNTEEELLKAVQILKRWCQN